MDYFPPGGGESMTKETQKALDTIKEQLELLKNVSKETSDPDKLANLTNSMANLISTAKTLIFYWKYPIGFGLFSASALRSLS